MSVHRWVFVFLMVVVAQSQSAQAADEVDNTSDSQDESEDQTPSMGKKMALGQNFSNSKQSFGINATLGTSVGIGTFLPGYARVPSLVSSLSISPSYRLPSLGHLPPMVLSASESFSWRMVDSYTTSISSANNPLTYSDLSFSLNAPNIVTFEGAGISLFPSVGISIPLSKSSIALGRVLGVNISNSLNWNFSDFVASWTPSFSAWFHSSPNIAMSCGDARAAALGPVINPQNAGFSMEPYLQEIVAREGEERGDGTCIVSGRQSIGTLGNYASIVWAPGQHALSAGLGWYIQFLRPLTSRPDFRGLHASGQGFAEATMGRIAYSYTVPVNFSLVISGGVLSYQSSFNNQGSFNFPFFDFVTPGKNQTQFFIQLTAGI